MRLLAFPPIIGDAMNAAVRLILYRPTTPH